MEGERHHRGNQRFSATLEEWQGGMRVGVVVSQERKGAQLETPKAGLAL